MFYHEKTKLFFVTFSNNFITNSSEISSFWIDFWWFFYFQKYGTFIKIKINRKRKDKILVTNSFKDLFNWIYKNKESDLKIENDLKVKKLKEIINKKINDFYFGKNITNESFNNKKQLFITPDSKISNDWLKNTEKDISKFDKYPTLERNTLTKTRIGQGWFREELIKKYKMECPITLIKNPKLLFASHVKPWRNSNQNEKLDFKNGILLSPLFDKLLDGGLISFQDEGNILYSKKLSSKFILKLQDWIENPNYSKIIKNNVDKKYLKWHRKKLFIK